MIFQVIRTPQPATPRTKPAATTRRWRRRGYWTRDEYGRMTWHTYPPFRHPETEFRPTTPLLVLPPTTTRVIQAEKTAVTETESRPPITFPVPPSSTSLPPQTSTTLATWWKRTPAWKTVRGYWARDRWSGKMVWRTYTTSTSSFPTLIQPTTPSGSKTLATTPAHITETSAQTVSTTSEVTQPAGKQTTGTSGQSVAGSRRPWAGSDTTREQTDAQTLLWLVSTVTPAAVSSTPSSSSSSSSASETTHSTLTKQLYTSSLHHIPTTITTTTTTTLATSVRDLEIEEANNRTNRTFTAVTRPNILPQPSTVTEISPPRSSTDISPAAKGGNDVIFGVVTSSTTERQKQTTVVDDEDGYWLVDETGKKLIFVRQNVTGHYADAWRQFIGDATSTAAPENRGRRPPGIRHPSAGELTRSSAIAGRPCDAKACQG